MQDDTTNEPIADDEFSPEEFETEGESEKDKIAKLRKELAEARRARDEYLTGWQRAKAEMVNVRKDAETALFERTRYSNRELILSLLPIVDSFDNAMRGSNWQTVQGEWRTGIEMIYAQLLSVLKANGAEPFNPTGEPYDAQLHEPVSMVPCTAGMAPHQIVETLQNGWKMGEKIIRAAKVVVSDET